MRTFPTKEQFTNWSLPAKASYIGLCITALAFFVQIVAILISGCQKETRPFVLVEIISPILRPDADGITRVRYRLKNSENMAVYDIRKGHRVFNEKGECLRHYYDFSEKYLLDLAPGARSLIHPDELGKLSINQDKSNRNFIKLQLIITYKKSKDKKSKLYYTLENYILIPIDCKEGYCNKFIMSKPSSLLGSMGKFIDECKEFK